MKYPVDTINCIIILYNGLVIIVNYYTIHTGSRAYVAALGQTSALQSLGLLGKIKYIGGISGGRFRFRVRVCLFAVPVSFLICEYFVYILYVRSMVE